MRGSNGALVEESCSTKVTRLQKWLCRTSWCSGKRRDSQCGARIRRQEFSGGFVPSCCVGQVDAGGKMGRRTEGGDFVAAFLDPQVCSVERGLLHVESG